MFQVRNLSKSYGTQVLFDDVSFVVGDGERVGVVGRNGSGKSTLLRIITGDETADAGSVDIGAGTSIGYLSQRLRFDEPTVLAEASAALGVNEDGWVETHRAEAVLDGLGFSAADVSGAPERLSGGFQVRLNLAKVLLSEPQVLLLDEPTNYLDITSMRWLERFLRGWGGEVLLVTHDRAFMDSVCTHTLGIWRERVRKVAGPTAKLYEQIAMEEEHRAQVAANEAARREQAEAFVARFRYKATKARQAQSRLKMLERMGRTERLADVATLEFRFPEAPFPGRRLLEASGLHHAFDGGADLLDGIGFEVGPHERIGVVGPNGRGKTTLLNVLAGEITPGSGVVERSPNLALGYFGQTNVDRLDPERTVEAEVLAALPTYNRGTARNLAARMMFEGDAALKKVAVLSGGERARVLLAKLLARPSNLLLLDEPTNHLDLESVETLTDAVDAFGGAVVVVTHDEDLLLRVAQRLVVFDGGKVRLFEAGYAEFLREVGWQSEGGKVAVAEDASRAGAKTDRKQERRRRAADTQARSRVLRPLERSIAETEQRITDLERDVAVLEQAIAAAAGDPSTDFAEMAWELHELQTRRDGAYETLDRLTVEYEARKSEMGGP
ncbi:MAG: ATP-binding cassette domain-containing protein [Acidimicrobiia bacterium]|nr:ATP-binding cassette domain-containing protein [Acidimicrobiia bacterium]